MIMSDNNKIVLRNVLKIPKCKMNPSIDPRTGRYPDHVRRVDSNGDMIFKDGDLKPKTGPNDLEPISELMIVELYDGKEFDLNDIHDRSVWEAIKYSPLIAEDRWQKDPSGKYVIDGDSNRYGSGEFYIERPVLESQLSNNKMQLVHNAQAFLFQDSREGLYIKARLVGANMSLFPYDEVLDFMLKEAAKQPNKIIDLYTGPDLRFRVLLATAIDKGILKEKAGVIFYNNITLGMSEDSAILFLKQEANKDLLNSVEFETFPENYKRDTKKEEIKVVPKVTTPTSNKK